MPDTPLYTILNKIITKIVDIKTNKADNSEITSLNNRIGTFEGHNYLTSNDLPTDHVSSDEVRNMVKLTESQYEGLQTKNANTLYVIVEDDS